MNTSMVDALIKSEVVSDSNVTINRHNVTGRHRDMLREIIDVIR
jgi:hypothetical protein